MQGIAYDAIDHGHRRSYRETWAHEFGLRSYVAPPSFRVFRELIRAHHLVFSTLDDAPFFFFFIGLIRSLFGRNIVGIFLRPHACFRRHHWKYFFKWLYFRFLSIWPRMAVITIVPYFVNQRYNEVSRDWIYDPQNWDLAARPFDLERRTALAAQVLAHAGGRKIIVAIGGLNRFKGFDYFAAIASRVTSPGSDCVFVACGPLAHDAGAAKELIEQAGGFVVGSYISDDDIAALYGIADLVWACYPERNDQASGIFGRASQLGVPAIVREGSYNAMQAARLAAPHLEIPFGEPEKAADLIRSSNLRRKPPDWALVEALRRESLDKLRAYI